MGNELVVKGRIDEKTVRNFLFTSETQLTEKQQNMFLQIAVSNNLNPFNREIYAIAYGKEFSIVTGYQVYIERAEAGGNLNGWSCENTDEGAKVIIHRKDWDHPFEWTASYEEFDKGQGSWTKMRKFMIRKVCIGQGFRLAFPKELGSLPYLQEEMEGAKPYNQNQSKPPVQKSQSKSSQKKQTGTGKEGKVEKGEVITKVLNSETVDFDKTDGTKGTRYIINSVGGTKYKTFDKKVKEAAEGIEGTDVEALILFKTDKWGHTIKSFELA